MLSVRLSPGVRENLNSLHVCLVVCTVSREDSSQSLASCLNLLPSPLDPSGDRVLGKENIQR